MHALRSRYSAITAVLSLLTVAVAVFISPMASSSSSGSKSSSSHRTSGATAVPAGTWTNGPETAMAAAARSVTPTTGSSAVETPAVHNGSTLVASRSGTAPTKHTAAAAAAKPVPSATTATTKVGTAGSPATTPATPTTTTSTTTPTAAATAAAAATHTTTSGGTIPSGPSTAGTASPPAFLESPPSKAQLMDPSTDYYGVAANGVPFETATVKTIDSEVGKAPSAIEWYAGWDQAYQPAAVVSSWELGALPIITWESMPSNDPLTPGQSRADDPTYSLSNIINGNFDAYIQSYAQAVVQLGLPVVIRFDQEMNGTWYPWSETANGNKAGQFVQMWRHVWDIFQQVGANNDVIWLWCPNRVDRLSGHSPAVSEVYPGDQYVDWMGLDAYYRYVGDPTTFNFTFGKTLSQLNAINATKPIFLAEVGAIENGPYGNSLATTKAAWTTNLFSGIAADHQIVGFSWFDNTVTNIVNGQTVTDDWQFDADPLTLAAFKAGVTSTTYTGGVVPTTS
jgi:mannan endo-1,4-beta-mannosidase